MVEKVQLLKAERANHKNVDPRPTFTHEGRQMNKLFAIAVAFCLVVGPTLGFAQGGGGGGGGGAGGGGGGAGGASGGASGAASGSSGTGGGWLPGQAQDRRGVNKPKRRHREQCGRRLRREPDGTDKSEYAHKSEFRSRNLELWYQSIGRLGRHRYGTDEPEFAYKSQFGIRNSELWYKPIGRFGN